MALFGGNKESKEEKQARKEQMILERYGMQNLHNKEDVESVKRIAQELAGENFFDLGVAFGGANEKNFCHVKQAYSVLFWSKILY